MLGGGARRMAHFLGLVGGDTHITINGSTAEELLEAEPKLEAMLLDEPDKAVVAELLENCPDFKKSWTPDGMPEEEFEQYAPLTFFRDMFVKGWNGLIEICRKAREE